VLSYASIYEAVIHHILFERLPDRPEVQKLTEFPTKKRISIPKQHRQALEKYLEHDGRRVIPTYEAVGRTDETKVRFDCKAECAFNWGSSRSGFAMILSSSMKLGTRFIYMPRFEKASSISFIYHGTRTGGCSRSRNRSPANSPSLAVDSLLYGEIDHLCMPRIQNCSRAVVAIFVSYLGADPTSRASGQLKPRASAAGQRPPPAPASARIPTVP
jgi:hypothetical protein